MKFKNCLIYLLAITVFVGCEKNNETENPPSVSEDYVARYLLNGNALDDSSNKNDGEITGNVAATVDRNENEGSAMFFDGISSYIEVGDVQELKITNAISISVWVNVYETSQIGTGLWQHIVTKGRYSSGSTQTLSLGSLTGFHLAISHAGLGSALVWNVNDNFLMADAPFPKDTWNHIVVTFDNTSIKMFLNGSLIKEASSENELEDNTEMFRIGDLSQDRAFRVLGFYGAIDDVIVYDRVLSADEVTELYTQDLMKTSQTYI